MSEKKAKVVKPEVQAKFGPSLLVFLLVTAVILVGILVLGLDAHIPIVIAAMIVAVYGIILHVPFKDLEHAMIKTISESVPVLLLICIVGMLIGSWMSAGTVPVIIYVGLELLRPSIFLPFVAVMCAILSTMTGSSWTTCSTIGVAFMGISVGLGIPLPITAGAVACGAYFGDKQSPISDFCIYAAGVTKVDIYKHAKRMIWTTGPAFLISLVIFTIIGLKYSGGTLDASAIETIRGGLADVFKMGWPTIIPLVALIIMIILKLPSTASLTLAAVIGVLVAWLYQGVDIAAVLGNMMNGFHTDSPVAEVAKICNRGGITAMGYTLELMVVSLAMAGLFDRTGLLSSIVAKFDRLVRKPFGLITATEVVSALGGYVFCDPYMAAIVPVKAFGKRYEELGIDKCVLSRSISDGALTFCPIVPWGSSGVFTAAALGVATVQYLPYYFMYLTPIVGILLAAFGLGMYKYDYAADPEGQKIED